MSGPGSVTCVVVAAGRSRRFGGELPKLLVPWHGRPLLWWTLEAIDATPSVQHVVLVTGERVGRAWDEAGRPGRKVCRRVDGGASRQESVRNGVGALPDGTEIVLVHDGARPFASADLFARVVEAARRRGAAVPVLPVNDTVKRVADGRVTQTVPREELGLAQTPQGARRDVLERALRLAESAGGTRTDDVGLVEDALRSQALSGVEIEAVDGEPGNVKITHPEDLELVGGGGSLVGMGHDLHPLVAGRRFVLAGVDVQAGLAESERFGPSGHSDGDVLCHATCDALLGAAALGDIGTLFPDSAPENAGRASLEFVAAVVERLAELRLAPLNVSAVIRLERPRLAPFAPEIRAALASALGLPVGRVGLSAKRGEGLGPIGEGLAVACEAVASVGRVR